MSLVYCLARNKPLKFIRYLFRKKGFLILDKCNASVWFWIILVSIQLAFICPLIIYELKACTYCPIIDLFLFVISYPFGLCLVQGCNDGLNWYVFICLFDCTLVCSGPFLCRLPSACLGIHEEAFDKGLDFIILKTFTFHFSPFTQHPLPRKPALTGLV